jgi:P-type E1-E2 ATPase
MPLSIKVEGWRELALDHLVLDLNGTLALDGQPMPGVREALADLRGQLQCHLVTADTFGTAAGLFGDLVSLSILQPGNEAEQKRDLVNKLGPQTTAAIGNGANDVLMLQTAALGIAILGPEGAATNALNAADLVVTHPTNALELFTHPARLRASLRR